ncbi:MAG: PQQ-dependent sugar dehydrogenase, partial [Planctomycetota bacterium]
MRRVVFFAVVCTFVAPQLHAVDCEGVPAVDGTNITLELVSDDLDDPVDIVAAPGDEDRIFVVEKDGRIRIIELAGDRLIPRAFLDIAGRVRAGGERGLLGLAFHPDYAENGYFYVNYTRNSGAVCRSDPPPGCTGDISSETVISRFKVTNDPDVADASSELELLAFCQPFS